VDHQSETFYILTNKDQATNFKLVSTPVTSPGPANWKEVFPYDPAIKLDGVDCFKNFIAISGRQNGFSQIWIAQYEDKVVTKHRLNFDEPIYTVSTSVNCDYDTNKLRFLYSSMTTPNTTFDYDIETKEKILLKEKPCPHYDRTKYASERLEAIANDGTKIPISIVYRKDLRQPKTTQPVHLYGYGSYEICIDPTFSSSILPLLDRGVIYAIAHIRGGGEMGRTWYENAKYLNKVNTFTDFINCAEHLIKKGIASSSALTIEGRSAGGLLMGAVLNMRPDLFTAAIAGVPFVDVMATMSDATIPLTTGEWEEWGNPNEKKYFEYMLSYSPYENVKRQAYPNILVTSGLYDPRVAYWEPTKWVARLRDLKSDQNEILLKMDLSSGHFSASDRYHYLREKAFDLSFLLDQLKVIQAKDYQQNSKSQDK
jgi:oligopeptidase B